MYMRVWDIVKIANDPDEPRPLILCEYETNLFQSDPGELFLAIFVI